MSLLFRILSSNDKYFSHYGSLKTRLFRYIPGLTQRKVLRSLKKLCLLAFAANFTYSLNASYYLVNEPDEKSYNFVSTHSILIKAKPLEIWPQLVNFRDWMVDFDLSIYKGVEGQVGQVLRLYDGQDFFVQITSIIPYEQITLVNLPANVFSELSFGNTTIVLFEHDKHTEVRLIMSRRYTYLGTGENVALTKRKSVDFQENATRTWEEYLGVLKSSVEKKTLH